jgi:predicted DNA-binding transcriptional regulator YafY
MRLVAARGDGLLADAALRASAKIHAVLSDDRKETYSDSPLLAYSAHAETADESLDFLSPLRAALRERHRLHISYRDLKERESTRRIRPLGLTAFDSVWLLTAWCETKSDFRNFRVDRLESVERTGETFRRESGKEFNDYLKTL